MINSTEQSQLITEISRTQGGFCYEEFTSVGGIRGNFKVNLPEALAENYQLRGRFIGHIAAALAGVEAVAATGGAVDIAKEAAAQTGLPLVVIKKNQNLYFQTADANSHDIIAQKPRIGFIEDVTSTRSTTEQAIDHIHIRDLIDIVIVGWRRGKPAPSGMTTKEVQAHNKKFSFRDLFEVPSDLPVDPIIERYLPLWLPTEKMKYARLPELTDAA